VRKQREGEGASLRCRTDKRVLLNGEGRIEPADLNRWNTESRKNERLTVGGFHIADSGERVGSARGTDSEP